MSAKKRTEKMLKEAREKFIAHEKLSRASKGDNGIPLASKLRLAVPLGILAIALYTGSYVLMKKLMNKNDEPETAGGNLNVGDMNKAVPDPEPLASFGRQTFVITGQDEDGEFLVEDANKRW